MSILSWIIQLGPKCRGRGRFDYCKREKYDEREALNMEEGATSQKIQAATGSWKRQENRFSP